MTIQEKHLGPPPLPTLQTQGTGQEEEVGGLIGEGRLAPSLGPGELAIP